MSDGVLAGIRVVDFGRYIAGPYCAALLADLGADVIRIERRGGGEDRWVAPVGADGAGAMFLAMNRNKRAMTLDPACPEGCHGDAGQQRSTAQAVARESDFYGGWMTADLIDPFKGLLLAVFFIFIGSWYPTGFPTLAEWNTWMFTISGVSVAAADST